MTSYVRFREQRRRPAGGCDNLFRPRLEVLEDRALLSVCMVDRLTDTGEGEKLRGDLRYCIMQAQDGDTITFEVQGTIGLTRGELRVTRRVRVEGPGPDLLTIDAGRRSRLFSVANGATAYIGGLTMVNGFGEFLGGGILNDGTLTVSNSTITDNSVWDPIGASGEGGGIFNGGTLTVSYSIISGNSTDDNGGGGGISSGGRGTATVSHSVLSGNSPDGILNYGSSTISNSVIFGNRTFGIQNSGTLAISNSMISANVYGIRSSGTLAISNSTISRNRGSGMYIGGIVTVSNSTISGNQTSQPRSAGGITIQAFQRDTTVQLVNSTVADNTALNMDRTASQIYSGALGGGFQGTLRFRNTIISGNGERPNFFADVGGTFTTEGHNLSNDDSGDLDPKLGDLPNTDPLLGPLQDNGGPTWTHALLPGSPALDAGDNTDAPEFDQRGLPRIVADIIDIGAFEVQPGPATWFWLDAPAEVASAVPFDITLFALDDYGHLATGYTGAVTFFATDKDPGVLLPTDYTFTADDQGTHTFTGETVLVTPGEQSLWALDADGRVSGEAVLTVVPGGAPGAPGGRSWAVDLVRALLGRCERSGGFWGVPD